MIRRDWPAHSYEATMWDVVTNAHRYIPETGDQVLDLGAHFGMFALYAASRGAAVAAYEPIYANFQELMHTAEVAKEIGAGQIVPVNKAIWKSRGVMPLWKRPSKPCYSALARVPDDELTPHAVPMHQAVAITLDDALENLNWECVKIDIEGAEHAVLMNCHKFSQIGFLTVEIHNDLLSSDECDDIDALLRDVFITVNRLPVKQNPTQTVAYFCSGEK